MSEEHMVSRDLDLAASGPKEEEPAALRLARRVLEYVGWFNGTYGPAEILDADAELQRLAMAVFREHGEPEPQIIKRLKGKRP